MWDPRRERERGRDREIEREREREREREGECERESSNVSFQFHLVMSGMFWSFCCHSKVGISYINCCVKLWQIKTVTSFWYWEVRRVFGTNLCMKLATIRLIGYLPLTLLDFVPMFENCTKCVVNIINLQPKPLPIISRPYMRGLKSKRKIELVDWKQLTRATVNISLDKHVVGLVVYLSGLSVIITFCFKRFGKCI